MPRLDDPQPWLPRHGDALYRYALLHLRDAALAEELVQETLLAGLESQHNFAGQSSTRTWLVAILKHKMLDHYRRLRREQPEAEPDAQLADMLDPAASQFLPDGHWTQPLQRWGDPHGLAQRQQFLLALEECLASLPPRLARLFMLRTLLDEASETLCQELAITPTNLWTLLYRARMGLRRCLERDWQQGESV